MQDYIELTTLEIDRDLKQQPISFQNIRDYLAFKAFRDDLIAQAELKLASHVKMTENEFLKELQKYLETDPKLTEAKTWEIKTTKEDDKTIFKEQWNLLLALLVHRPHHQDIKTRIQILIKTADPTVQVNTIKTLRRMLNYPRNRLDYLYALTIVEEAYLQMLLHGPKAVWVTAGVTQDDKWWLYPHFKNQIDHSTLTNLQELRTIISTHPVLTFPANTYDRLFSTNYKKELLTHLTCKEAALQKALYLSIM